MNDTDAYAELQIKVAFLEDTVTKLSDEFYLQQRELDDLKIKYQALINKLSNSSDNNAGTEQVLDERPPHY